MSAKDRYPRYTKSGRNLPRVQTFDTVGWICLDCGTENSAHLITIEDPEKMEQIRVQFDGRMPGKAGYAPTEVRCSQCQTIYACEYAMAKDSEGEEWKDGKPDGA